MCYWSYGSKFAVHRLKKTEAKTAYKRLKFGPAYIARSNKYVDAFKSPYRASVWTNLKLIYKGHVSRRDRGIYCFKNIASAHKYGSGNVTVKLKVWGEVAEHPYRREGGWYKQEYAGFRAQKAEIIEAFTNSEYLASEIRDAYPSLKITIT